MDIKDHKWKEGDVEHFVAGGTMKIEPGLFFYSGFGYGTLYLRDGVVCWCSTSEAAKECRDRGENYRFVDSFDGYRPVYLGD